MVSTYVETCLYSETLAPSFPSMEAFIRFLERGLLDGKTIQRQAQIDSVSEFLDQAEDLLNDVSVHPAAPTMVMGAALEEFLRGWFNDEGLPLGEKNRE